MPTKLRCNVCGKPARVVAASAYGATSYAFLGDCLAKGLEPYSGVVAYIACAGHFPEDTTRPTAPTCAACSRCGERPKRNSSATSTQ